MSLYSDLDLSPDASPADIKRAYRRKASEHHPDKGGDPDQFHRISKAYGILSDPTKRDRYDQTGDADTADEWDQHVSQNFASMILGLLDEDEPNIVAAAKKQLSQELVEIQITGQKLNAALARNRKHLARFKRTAPGADHLTAAIHARIAALEAQLRNLETQRRMHAALTEELTRYEFEVRIATPDSTSGYSLFGKIHMPGGSIPRGFGQW